MRQALYKLAESVPDGEAGKTKYVVSSHSLPHEWVPPETMVFPANEQGEIIDFGELDSWMGHVDHDVAVGELGEAVFIRKVGN